MKILHILFCISILLTTSCDDDDDNAGPITFEFKFSSFGGPVQGDTSCGAPPIFLIRQEGTGTNKLLGNFIFVAQFCNNLETGEYFGGPSAFGYFEDENGDRLNVISRGQIIPTNKEGYDLMFQDPITIDGGTGRFKGASGSGMTDSFVNLAAGRTDHIWKGTLVLN